MSIFNPGIVELGGNRKRYVEWLQEFASANDTEGVRRLMREVISERPSRRFDPAHVRVHAERIAGLNSAQAAWAATLFEQLVGESRVARAIRSRNSNVTMREAFRNARALRVASQIETLQLGPRSVLLVEVAPSATDEETKAMANALQSSFGAAVIVKPSGINISLLSVQELSRLRDRITQLLPGREA